MKVSTDIKGKFEISAMLKNIYTEMEVSPVGLLKNYALNLILVLLANVWVKCEEMAKESEAKQKG